MKITLQELVELNACQEGLKRFVQQTNGTDEPVDVISLIGGLNTHSDLLWLADKKLPKEKIVKFACNVALINIELIKPYCLESEYQTIVDFLNNPKTYNTAAAYVVRAARAADAARAAAYAVRAARAAAYAARAADAAYAAARAARVARAAKQNSIEKINQYLVELFAE